MHCIVRIEYMCLMNMMVIILEHKSVNTEVMRLLKYQAAKKNIAAVNSNVLLFLAKRQTVQHGLMSLHRSTIM